MTEVSMPVPWVQLVYLVSIVGGLFGWLIRVAGFR
jgi:hypothetical protein